MVRPKLVPFKNQTQLSLKLSLMKLINYLSSIGWLIFFFLRSQTNPLKLAPERIEPETLRRSILLRPKPIPLGQPKWVNRLVKLTIILVRVAIC